MGAPEPPASEPPTSEPGTIGRVSRLPTLGPRGEGWVAIQGVLFVIIGAAAYSLPGDAGGLAPVLVAVGAALFVIGVAIAVVASACLLSARALTAVPHPRREASLVTGGPYRWIRHPIYSGIVLAAIGLSVARASIVALAASLVLLAFFDLKRRREEAWLREQIPGYAEYAAGTRALIVRIY